MYKINIQKARIIKGLSINQLAILCELSKSVVSEIANGNGNPTISTINKLARVLGPDILFWEEDRYERK